MRVLGTLLAFYYSKFVCFFPGGGGGGGRGGGGGGGKFKEIDGAYCYEGLNDSR